MRNIGRQPAAEEELLPPIFSQLGCSGGRSSRPSSGLAGAAWLLSLLVSMASQVASIALLTAREWSSEMPVVTQACVAPLGHTVPRLLEPDPGVCGGL